MTNTTRTVLFHLCGDDDRGNVEGMAENIEIGLLYAQIDICSLKEEERRESMKKR